MFDYGVVKGTISNAVAWVEQTLTQSGLFRLPSKKKLLKTDSPIEGDIVDATECEIERLKKIEKLLFRKKKRHTFKLQIIADARTRDVICISTATGRRHDFTLLKDSRRKQKCLRAKGTGDSQTP